MEILYVRLRIKLLLLKEFESYCSSRNMHAIYIIVSEEFAHLLIEHLPFSFDRIWKKIRLDPINI